MSKRWAVSSDPSTKSAKKPKVTNGNAVMIDLSEAEQRQRALEWAEKNNLLSPSKNKRKSVKPAPTPKRKEPQPEPEPTPEPGSESESEAEPEVVAVAVAEESDYALQKKRAAEWSEKNNLVETKKKRVVKPKVAPKEEEKGDEEEEEEEEEAPKRIGRPKAAPKAPTRVPAKKIAPSKISSAVSKVEKIEKEEERKTTPKLPTRNLPKMSVAKLQPEASKEGEGEDKEEPLIESVVVEVVRSNPIPFYMSKMFRTLSIFAIVAACSVVSYNRTDIGIPLLAMWTVFLVLYVVILTIMSAVRLIT